MYNEAMARAAWYSENSVTGTAQLAAVCAHSHVGRSNSLPVVWVKCVSSRQSTKTEFYIRRATSLFTVFPRCSYNYVVYVINRLSQDILRDRMLAFDL